MGAKGGIEQNGHALVVFHYGIDVGVQVSFRPPKPSSFAIRSRDTLKVEAEAEAEAEWEAGLSRVTCFDLVGPASGVRFTVLRRLVCLEYERQHRVIEWNRHHH